MTADVVTWVLTGIGVAALAAMFFVPRAYILIPFSVFTAAAGGLIAYAVSRG